MQTEKNKWVEDVLGSADHIRRVNAPDMTEHILSRTGEKQIAASYVIWRIAASIVLLVALNVSTIYVYNSYRHKETQGQSQDTASLFGLGGAEGGQADIGTVFFGK